jgi:DNA-directed RNA polymerase beta subunit
MLELDKIVGLIQTGKTAAVTAGGRINRTSTAPTSHDNEEYVGVGLDGILAASGKLLAVNRGESTTDERDSLTFKRIMTPDRLMRERVRIDADKSGMKLMRALARKRTLKAMTPFHFDNYATGLLLGNPLSSPLEEINPMHIVEQARRVTLMGPGGIGTPQAITSGMQAVHASQFGFLDPLHGPESERAGIDSRLAWGTRIGSDGRIYQQFMNRRTQKPEWLSPDQLDGKTIRLPA